MTTDEKENAKSSFWGDLWFFIKTHKKYWLLPILMVIVLLSIFIIFTESSALAPFIYDIF
jgi:Family of unknown function (DUF5989)